MDFFKGNGIKYVIVDTEGNCEALIPMLLECGTDAIWPIGKGCRYGSDPFQKEIRYKLRLFGGVDKRELAKDKKAIDRHLAEMVPLVEEGGFIPTVDHKVSPDISLENFKYYMKRKMDLLCGRF